MTHAFKKYKLGSHDVANLFVTVPQSYARKHGLCKGSEVVAWECKGVLHIEPYEKEVVV